MSKLVSRLTASLRTDSGRLTLAIVVAAALLTPPNLYWHPAALGALALLPLAFVLRGRPRLAAICIALTGGILRLGWLDAFSGDQIFVSQQAAERVLDGLSPYGVMYPALPGLEAPYPYGPLAWLWWQPGVVMELAATAGILAICIWRRAWLTLAIFACWPSSIAMNATDTNDYSLTLFVALALATAESHPRISALSMACAGGLKVQAYAWALGLFMFLPTRARWLLAAVTALIWLPLLFWGVPGLFESIAMVDAMHQWNNGRALNMPWLRVLVIPAILLALRASSVTVVGLSGAAIFFLLSLTGEFGSTSHWLPIIGIGGLAFEMGLQSTLRRREA